MHSVAALGNHPNVFTQKCSAPKWGMREMGKQLKLFSAQRAVTYNPSSERVDPLLLVKFQNIPYFPGAHIFKMVKTELRESFPPLCFLRERRPDKWWRKPSLCLSERLLLLLQERTVSGLLLRTGRLQWSSSALLCSSGGVLFKGSTKFKTKEKKNTWKHLSRNMN